MLLTLKAKWQHPVRSEVRDDFVSLVQCGRVWCWGLGSGQGGGHAARVVSLAKTQDVPCQFGMRGFVAGNALEHRSNAAHRASGARCGQACRKTFADAAVEPTLDGEPCKRERRTRPWDGERLWGTEKTQVAGGQSETGARVSYFLMRGETGSRQQRGRSLQFG